MKKGKIIFLNGTGSTGKSTLAKTLQARLAEPFYHLSVDGIFSIWPEKYIQLNPAQTVSTALTALNHTIKTYSDIGINVIADYVFLEGDGKDYTATGLGLDNMEECVTLLHEHDVLFVHVTCPLDELRRREKERGDRPIGNAETMLSQLVPKDTYDITVDTFNNTKEECTDMIIKLLDKPKKHTAFKTLWRMVQIKNK
ncbi:MAG: chloramphenicol phosphotransferase CPT family protein [Defluviitaleaceae bacterium]|nr:chloramphenicol phosphotransferase CPT family protein [Defluviitaleaceae bacterium]